MIPIDETLDINEQLKDVYDSLFCHYELIKEGKYPSFCYLDEYNMEEYNMLKITEVESWNDAQLLRMLRNNCREFMTNHTQLITREEQRDWWDNLDKENFRAFLFHMQGQTIGYGVISTKKELSDETKEMALEYLKTLEEKTELEMDEDKYLENLQEHVAPKDWLTGGVITGWRGQGFGEKIFSHLINESTNPVWLEVREDNEPARKLYEKLGFNWTEQITREFGEGKKKKETDILVMRLGESEEQSFEELRSFLPVVSPEESNDSIQDSA